MPRSALALCLGLCLVPPASATLTPRKDPSPILTSPLSVASARSLLTGFGQGTSARNAAAEFNVTEQTEVTLDGRPCRYKDVPAGASIQLMELAPDRKTILRIHFRARK
jgi:hypothetical protein